MVKVSNLGYPRLGENREWKKLIEFLLGRGYFYKKSYELKLKIYVLNF